MNVTTKELWEQSRSVTKQPLPQSTAEPHPADDDFVPPVTSVKLPSRGLTYPAESPLFGLESVDIKAVTAQEENILSSVALIRKGTVLTTLMRACITNRLIDPDQMLVGDRNAVLTAIRVTAYGPRYSAHVSCPECREEADYDFDLGKLKLRMLDAEPVGGPGNNEFSFTLPQTHWEVRFRLLDAGAAVQLEKETEAIRKKTGQEKNTTMRLIAHVISLKGISDSGKVVRAINNLPARDSRALRIHMDAISPEVDMSQEYECPSCGKTSEVEIPLGTEFFWPSEAR